MAKASTIQERAEPACSDQHFPLGIAWCGHRIDKSELAKLEGRKLLPGMSSEAMIRTGARTVLSYLAEPIAQNFRRAMREK